MGQSWESYLLSLATAVHYAQHTQDDLYDAKGYLLNVWHVIWADGNVSKGELKRLLKTCNEVHQSLRIVYRDAKCVELNEELASALETDSWENLLGEFTLPPANMDNINNWMKAIENWIDLAAYHLGSLRSIALEQLLETEEMLAQAYINKTTLDQKAPSASVFPKEYKTLLPGQERQRQTKLDWWDSFQTATGILPAIMRTTIALTIIGAVCILRSILITLCDPS